MVMKVKKLWFWLFVRRFALHDGFFGDRSALCGGILRGDAYDSFFGYDYVHGRIVGFAGDILNDLEFISNPNFWGFDLFEQAVVEAFSVADAVAVLRENYAGDECGFNVFGCGAFKVQLWFADAEAAFFYFGEVVYVVEVESVFVFYSGQYKFFVWDEGGGGVFRAARGFFQERGEIHFAVNRQIKKNASGFFYFGKF
jgi:hypothetical protein